ncbi:uncharacterized protein B0H64DRAFT_54720 [Chaetomium fimeti]|uniref:Uncharacterized protein n=1 Tax=Chaetomium fimeti TaxID=1854472 RepID=A0AAE0LN32_9PEZI|nr:hypothetical protein B0H64DRAFT_54720 [Chaetomium fimeti]
MVIRKRTQARVTNHGRCRYDQVQGPGARHRSLTSYALGGAIDVNSDPSRPTHSRSPSSATRHDPHPISPGKILVNPPTPFHNPGSNRSTRVRSPMTAATASRCNTGSRSALAPLRADFRSATRTRAPHFRPLLQILSCSHASANGRGEWSPTRFIPPSLEMLHPSCTLLHRASFVISPRAQPILFSRLFEPSAALASVCCSLETRGRTSSLARLLVREGAVWTRPFQNKISLSRDVCRSKYE